MITRTTLTSLTCLVAVLAVGYVGVFIEASSGGYIADLLGRPTAGVAPRFPWELQFVIVVICFAAVLVVRQVLDGLQGKGLFFACVVPALLLCASYVIGVSLQGEVLVSNVLLRSYAIGAQSQMVLLAVGTFLVLVFSSKIRVPDEATTNNSAVK